MIQQEQRRRRIDRVTAGDYLDALEERDATQVRAMRDECREEEAHLSYVRRLLQGQLDIALVEVSRRTGGGDGGGTESLIAELPAILSDRPAREQREARSLPVYEAEDPARRTGDAERFAARVGRVPDAGDEELAALVADLKETERRVSDQRRVVLERLDRLQEELVRRYREGAASVDDLVTPTLSSGGDDRGR